MKQYINEALENYIKKDMYPWHMPGHKRRTVDKMCENVDNFVTNGDKCGYISTDMWRNMFEHDFTEAKDLDDMHEPQAFIADCLMELKKVYGTYATYMLVNGSTSGVLAGVHALCRKGDHILIARNCHKSVYNAICLLELEPEYMVPEYVDISLDKEAAVRSDILGEIKADQVKEKLQLMKEENRLPSAVVITSPTYEGIISDIEKIAAVVHDYGAYLIVDEAQGAHLHFMKGHKTAVESGADIVIESLHKTMPALTQTSLLHVMNEKIDPMVRRYLQIFQTSSPSYLFMQSMERAVAWADDNPDIFDEYRAVLSDFSAKCDNLTHINLFRPKAYDMDEGRLVFVIKPGTTLKDGRKLTGKMLGDILADEYGLVVEMTSISYVICISSPADSRDAYDKLLNALMEIDGETEDGTKTTAVSDEENRIANEADAKARTDRGKRVAGICENIVVIAPGAAWNLPRESVKLEAAAGRVAAAFVYAYPPGIPVVVPGEMIDRNTIDSIALMLEGELNVQGVSQGLIDVLTDK